MPMDKLRHRESNTKESKKLPRMRLTTKQKIYGWLFIAPALIALAVFTFYPIARGLLMSFQSKAAGEWTLGNYSRILIDPTFPKTIRNTVIYVIFFDLCMLPISMFLATLLNKKGLKGEKIYRVLLFLPATMTLMSYTTVFSLMFNKLGVINVILVKLGILSEPCNFTGRVWGARLIIILSHIWRWTGWNMVYYSAGYSQIDKTLYEAAELDGANGWQQWRYISLPELMPWVVLTTIFTTSGALQILDEISSLTKGGPANRTLSTSLYIYNTAFSGKMNFNYASAMGFVLAIAIIILTIIQRKVADKRD